MRVNVSGCVWVAFVCCCFACDCVLELVVCRVRFARVSCPRLRFGNSWAPWGSVQFSYYINNRQPNGSLSNVLSRLAVGVRVDGDDETQRKEHEREGDQEETRHRVLACVPSEYR